MGPVVERSIIIEFEIRHVAQIEPAGQGYLDETERTLEALLHSRDLFGSARVGKIDPSDPQVARHFDIGYRRQLETRVFDFF
jgi:hypothetical protein